MFCRMFALKGLTSSRRIKSIYFYPCAIRIIFVLSGKEKIDTWFSSQKLSQARMCSSFTARRRVTQCLSNLGLEEGASLEDVRMKYLELAKKYHPDSKTPDACPEKFQQIFKSYQFLMSHHKVDAADFPDDVGDNPEEKDFGIHHTAPQHRQFLEYGGVGYGTPSQRMKQYQHHKVEKAVEGVYDHQLKVHGATSSDLSLWEKKTIKKTRITKAINRLVEDLIQESMSKGEFDDLPGSGQPIKQKQLHHMDFTTAKVNQILVDSGFVPEWILLEKEIKGDIKHVQKLISERRTLYGPQPFTRKDSSKWNKEIEYFEKKSSAINKKIDKFNLIVPILNKQRIHFDQENYIRQANIEYMRNRTVNEEVEDKIQEDPVDLYLQGLAFILKHMNEKIDKFLQWCRSKK